MEYLSIHIRSKCKNEYEDIEEFLLSFGSTQIEKVTFTGHISQIKNENYDSEDEWSDFYKVYPCSSYFYGLRDVISKAIKYISIRKILLSSKEFSAILRAAKHVKRLHFTDCKILTDYEHELGEMEGWKIDILSVDYSIHVFKNSRDYEDNCMKMFLSIVGCTNLLWSLRYLQFKCEREMGEKLLFEAKEILGNDYDMLMPWFECL